MKKSGWEKLPRLFVPFDWHEFWLKHRFLLSDTNSPVRVAGQMLARFGLLAVNEKFWLWDDLLIPGWTKHELFGPVFIIGHQRSGTTFLHRALARDPNARALTLHEMALPAVTAQRLIAAIARWDSRHAAHIRRNLDRMQDRFLGRLDHIHRIRLDSIEEDEFVLWSVFRSGMCVNDNPASVARRELDHLRDFRSWPESEQQVALTWYRACLLKKIHREPPADSTTPAWIVAKNPAFSQRIPQLLRVFPDAKFILLVRNPLETIPSRLSLIREIWRLRYTEIERMSPAQVATIVDDSVRTYAYAQRDRALLRSDQLVEIRYTALKTDLRVTIEKVYAQLELPGPPLTIGEGAGEMDRAGHHRYSLTDFGLSEADIRGRLSTVFETYGF